MTIAPNAQTGAVNCTNLTTHGDHRFFVWYTRTGELRIGRAERGVQTVGVDHDEYEFAGAPRTTLALPTGTDEHTFASVGVDGNGRIHVMANMHNHPLRYVMSVDPHTTDGWLSTAGWTTGTLTDVDPARNTYPLMVRLTDGGLWLYLRGSQASSHADSFFWTRGPTDTSWSPKTMLFQGLEVPDAGGPGVPGSGTSFNDETNWNAYPTTPYVESSRDPNPGRMHMAWEWSGGQLGESPDHASVMLGYAYSNDGGHTWHAIDGTVLTLPITPLNNLAARIPGSAFIKAIGRGSGIVIAEVDTPDHGIQVGNQIGVDVVDDTYDGTFTVGAVLTDPPRVAWGQAAGDDVSGGTGALTKYPAVARGALAIDDSGLPHMLLADARHHIRRNDTNTAWVISALPGNIGGFNPASRFGGAFWLRGDLWGLCMSLPSGDARQRLFQITGDVHPTICLSGLTSAGWEPCLPDPEAWRRFGTIETLVPDGDKPLMFTFGNHARALAAAT